MATSTKSASRRNLRVCVREIREARAWLKLPPGRIRDDVELLQVANWLFELVVISDSDVRPADRITAQRLLPLLRRRLAQVLARPPRRPAPLTEAIRGHKLGPIDLELLLLSAISGLGVRIGGLSGADVEDLSQILIAAGHSPLDVGRAFQPHAPLQRSGLIRVAETGPWQLARVSLAPSLRRALSREEGADSSWTVTHYPEFLERLAELVYAMENSEESEVDDADLPDRLHWLLESATATLQAHPDWPLAPAVGSLSPKERIVLLALAAKDLGHLPCGAELFTGRGLVAGMGMHRRGSARAMALFSANAALRRRGWIRPSAGGDFGGVERPAEEALAEASWELTEEARLQFAIPLRRRLSSGGLRQARVRLDQLVLQPEAREALELATAQGKHSVRLFEDWGLGATLGYGRGTTLLFSGPPGVGKTAAAEALAHGLDRPLLEADASQLLSCWLGETEKQLARLFREASQSNAVLFFDEADAFFYDRAQAQRTWEVSHVNMLLREIERYEGVCILATNRRDGLDPALERRLTLRVEFRPPTHEMSERIWRILLPEKMPLAADVDFPALGRLGLTGGQIKNAVLNAARRALALGEEEVSMTRLLEGARKESERREASIGFTALPSTRTAMAERPAARHD